MSSLELVARDMPHLFAQNVILAACESAGDFCSISCTCKILAPNQGDRGILLRALLFACPNDRVRRIKSTTPGRLLVQELLLQLHRRLWSLQSAPEGLISAALSTSFMLGTAAGGAAPGGGGAEDCTRVFMCGEGTGFQLPYAPTSGIHSFPRHEEWVLVTAGQNHVLALSATGGLYSKKNLLRHESLDEWDEDCDALGRGADAGVPAVEADPLTCPAMRAGPVAVEGGEEAVSAAAAGHVHSLLVAGKTAYSMGREAHQSGALGHGPRPPRCATPRRIEALAQVPVVAVAAGMHHSLFVSADGGLYTCGAGDDGVLGHGDERTLYKPRRVGGALHGEWVYAAAAGYRHTVALAESGACYTWGDGRWGQLGHGPAAAVGQQSKVLAPRALGGCRPRQRAGPEDNSKFVVGASAGMCHTLLVRADGRVDACGRGNDGQLGLGPDTRDRDTPVRVGTLRDEIIVTVSAGRTHSLFAAASGRVYSCGRCSMGGLGHGKAIGRLTTPTEIRAVRSRRQRGTIAS